VLGKESGVGNQSVLIISSVHDYRMARRGSVQAIADAFVRAGYETAFLSVRFSPLSMLKRDPRVFLAPRANRIEVVNDIKCYLWRTPFHPFATGSSLGDALTAPWHDIFASWPNAEMDRLIAGADVILVESGLAITLIPRARRLNRKALLIYRGSDPLDVIGAHPLLQRLLHRFDPLIDHQCLLASAMAPHFNHARAKTYVVRQAIHRPDFAGIASSPYQPGTRNAVCVGSMLFDPQFFSIAAPARPDVTFHVIGCGAAFPSAANVRVYPEMPFRQTLPFIQHADIGVAPYREAPASYYLAESSLKLTQFAYLRRPAVCPHFAAGKNAHRFGYTPGDGVEIAAALRAALGHRFTDAPPLLTWDDAVQRLLRPQDFADTHIDGAMFEPLTRNDAAARQAADVRRRGQPAEA
jgi:2-beta-glucuronyltransferase